MASRFTAATAVLILGLTAFAFAALAFDAADTRAQRPRMMGPPPWYGMSTDAEPESGLLVEGVTPGGPADRAGLEVGDYIIKIDGKDTVDGQPFEAFTQSARAGTDVAITWLAGGKREKDGKIGVIDSPQNVRDDIDWINNKLMRKYNDFEAARNGQDYDRMLELKEELAEIVEDNEQRVEKGFEDEDEFRRYWSLAYGFRGKSERKDLEKLFEQLNDPKTRRGDKPAKYRQLKLYVCHGLTAMASPDTDIDTIKAFVSTGDIMAARYGAELISAIFVEIELAGKRGGERKAKRLAEDLVKAEIVTDLGEPIVGDLENLDEMKKMVDQYWPLMSRLSPSDRNVIYNYKFYCERAEAFARALGRIPDRQSIKYLLKFREGAKMLEGVCKDGLERLFPEDASISYEWYVENAQYLYWDDDTQVWKLAKGAQKAGIPAEEWLDDHEPNEGVDD